MNHHAIASGRLPFDKPQKPAAWQGSSSRTTPYFPHDTCEIPSQSRSHRCEAVVSGLGNSLSTVLFGRRYQVHAAAEDQKALTSLAISG